MGFNGGFKIFTTIGIRVEFIFLSCYFSRVLLKILFIGLLSVEFFSFKGSLADQGSSADLATPEGINFVM